jgi:hypothetical protein
MSDSDSDNESTASSEAAIMRKKSTKPALLHFKFDNFADLPSDVDSSGSEVWSVEETDCNGNEWSLLIYPGGESESDQQGFIALYLFNHNKEEWSACILVPN